VEITTWSTPQHRGTKTWRVEDDIWLPADHLSDLATTCGVGSSLAHSWLHRVLWGACPRVLFGRGGYAREAYVNSRSASTTRCFSMLSATAGRRRRGTASHPPLTWLLLYRPAQQNDAPKRLALGVTSVHAGSTLERWRSSVPRGIFMQNFQNCTICFACRSAER